MGGGQVAGARLTNNAILITGLTGLLAGACSMAIGESVSVQSARELYQRQVQAAEIRAVPDDEEEELALIYESQGLAPKRGRTSGQAADLR